MSGVICLQGGRELTPPCVEMDAMVVTATRRVRREVAAMSPDRTVVAVLAGAARVGSDYAGASERTRRHYTALDSLVDTPVEVRAVPDPRDDHAGALAALDESIDLLVLPGGSPTSLHGVLQGEVGQRICALWGNSAMGISGASAGAMVLCSTTHRPDRRPADTVPGLGLVDGVALVHWSPTPSPPALPDETFWGLPECGGALITGIDEATPTSVVAVGQGHAAVSRNGVWEQLPRPQR